MRQSQNWQPRERPPALTESEAGIRDQILAKLSYSIGRDRSTATDHDWFLATALAVRDQIVDSSLRPDAGVGDRKCVNYLSIEFLIGRLLCDAISNLHQLKPLQNALSSLGLDLDRLRSVEPDAALGSGGLGRLAACFMDSMASLRLPAFGYGIRYQLGLFKQSFADGWQQELPDDWLASGNPWEFARPEIAYPIRFGGLVEYIGGSDDTARALWYPAETILAQAYDTPVVGWRAAHVNTLRLWHARPAHMTSLRRSGAPNYADALAARVKADAICQNLYPSEATPAGRELRLRQEYFFTSASLQDIIYRHLQKHPTLDSLPAKATVQLNDTHPAIAVAELMRILVDEHEFSWTRAWDFTRGMLNYTNHTLLPEALESWPVSLLNELLPRQMQIIYLINDQHLRDARARGITEPGMTSALSLIGEGEDKRVRMGHLAFVGSNRVNGVSALHTQLMRQTTFRDLNAALPDRIVNKTNGISVRRWLLQANPRLAALIMDTIGPSFLDEVDALKELEGFAGDAGFVHRFSETRLQNKALLAHAIYEQTGYRIDCSALFDVHVKRIHEYKRQLLNLLETIALYQSMRARPHGDWVPRVKIFAGKAAPDYFRAKLIIKLAHDIARIIDSDPAVTGLLKVVFIPNYSVSLAEAIIPAADLSEQISTAGMEASGTGNMKLALNGALTVGTLDGANVEIRDRVGPENFFEFGLSTAEVEERRRARFQGATAVTQSPVLAQVIDSLAAGEFSPDEPARYRELVDAVLGYDHFMVAADFDAYWRTQRSIDAAWREPAAWWRAGILNTARMSWFSSDRTIREYADGIWGIDL